jgi:DNA invertase Pin-like site-specific DNA recombinase
MLNLNWSKNVMYIVYVNITKIYSNFGGNMIYGYLRVSTDKQTLENQRFEIERFCSNNNMKIEQWIEEKISGTKLPEKRLLGSLLSEVKKGDLIICSELSRLGRSIFMIMSILNYLMNNGIKVWTIKDNYRLGDNIQSKVLAFAFGLSAEIERDLISQRIKEALARKKSEGAILGRPRGRKSNSVKLSGKEKEIHALLEKKVSKSAIGRIYGVHRMTVDSFLKTRMA